MKRILLIAIIILISLISISCSSSKEDSLNLDEPRYKEEEVKYEIEQILFSKSFQSFEPSVEIITNNNKLKILASLGLSEYSNINVNSITKKGSQVNINVSGISGNAESRLAVPQVIIEFKKSALKQIEGLKFNIVYDDYIPLKVKYGINDVLNKIQSHSKVATKSTPTFNLAKVNDDIIWDISYNNIFDKETSNINLVNLMAQVNANTGDIITLDKSIISSSIDSGSVLSYANDTYILYKKPCIIDNKSLEQLWVYNAESNEKIMLYSSSLKISSAQFNSNFEYVSVIEASDTNSDVYIIPLSDKRAYKLIFEDNFNPKTMKWSNDDTLYLMENNTNSSIVYSYNIKENLGHILGKFNKNIESLIISKDSFIITEKIDDGLNRRISLTTDWRQFRQIGSGFNPKFINENKIAFMQHHKDDDLSHLFLYDIAEREIIDEIGENISNYEIFSGEEIIYTRKNPNLNNFSLVKYTMADQSTLELASLIGDKIYYDEDRKLIYLNIILPFDNEKTEMIYALDLEKLN